MECKGTGEQWVPGTGIPICPVCHRGVKSITGKRRTMGQVSRSHVPSHEGRYPGHARGWTRDEREMFRGSDGIR